MNDSELKEITKNFAEIKPLILEEKEVKSKMNKVRRRLKTKLHDYSFLIDLIGIKSHDTRLAEAVIKLLKSIGFESVENMQKSKKEDIRVWFEDILLLIEVTGSEKKTTKEEKSHQISKHIPINQNIHKDKKVKGLLILNHDNENHYLVREKKPFTKEMGEIAKSHNYTLMTTLDLLNMFLDFKEDKITPVEIMAKLCSTGELKITRGG
jgi:hypothetical protein